MNEYAILIKENRVKLFLSVFIGIFAYILSVLFSEVDLADPLLIALFLGVIVGTFFPDDKKINNNFLKIIFLFITPGIIFYGLNNLNFSKSASLSISHIILLIVVILVYYFVCIGLGKILKQKEKLTYLTATGGAICGASAITVMAPVIEADSEDVSISIISVFISAVFGLFVVFPFLGVIFGLSNEIYAMMSGSVMQFSGFVKASIASMPPLSETMEADKVSAFAMSIKAFRYLGLLVAIPLFASLLKRKLYLPWYLWAFLGAGIIGTILSNSFGEIYVSLNSNFVRPSYEILWSISMVAIGINTNISKVTSNSGMKAILMAFLSFVSAIIVFLIGIRITL